MNDHRVKRLEGVSGRVWIVDERQEAVAASPGKTTPFYGWPEGQEHLRHWIQRALGESDAWEPERDGLRRAYRIGQMPEIASSPYIHTAVDLIESFDVYLVSKLGETDLGRVLRDGPVDSDELERIEERLRAALAVLHKLRLVHSDVREDNVLRVAGQWKLGDLGGAVGFDEPIISLQRDKAYRRDGAALGAPATPENDLHALAIILEHARTRHPD